MLRNRMGMALVLRWIMVVMLALFPIASHALALGKLKVLSALNEPLNAEIEFTSITEKELKGLTASLASRADFNAASVDRPPFLSQIKFVIAKKLDGRYFLELHTEQELNEPFLHLLLQIDWSGGRLVREYTALIDPPYKIVGKAAPVEVPKITAPAPKALPPAPSLPPVAAAAPQEEIQKQELPPIVAKSEEPKAEEFPLKEEPAKETTPDEKIDTPPESPSLAVEIAPEDLGAPKVEPLEAAPKTEIASAPEEQPTVSPESKPAPAPVWAAMSEYNVKRGDALWRIAEKVRADNKDFSTEQVILAIYRANKDAFFGNNVNNLKAGKILKIPEREEVESVTSPEARREFRAQYDTWQEYKLKLASASRVVKVADAPATPSKSAGEQPAPPPVAESEQTKPPKAPPVADKKKQEELLKIVRNTLQQEKSTPDKKITEKESAKDAAAREQQALAERTATLEETLESKRLENKDLSEKVGVVRSQLKKESRLIELEGQSLAPQRMKPPETKPAEPIVKPAEKPAAPKPEEKAKVESLPPAAKPAAVPPAAPKKSAPPAPAPAEEKGFLASMLEAVQSDLLVPVVIGIVVLLTGGIALVYFRRRQKSIAEFEESILSGDAISTEQPSTGDSQTQGAVTTGGDTSFLSDFSQGGMGNIHTDEVDPVAEAEVYLAYGRDETAEEILKEAVVKHPERHELKLKLLEIYHQRNDVAAFETLAEELYAALGGRGGKIWEKVEEMGRKLNPENPMFRGGAPAKSPASAKTAKSAALAAATMASTAFSGDQVSAQPPGTATTKPESAGDFDFNIEAPAEAPASAPDYFSVARPETPAKAEAGTSLESIDLGAPVDNAIEFDAGEKSDAAVDLDLSDLGDAAPAGNDNKWEPESAAAAAPAAESQGSSQWDETATKLDLAKAYIDMGDAEGARSILQEVMSEGNEAQKKQAQELSAQLA